MFLLLIVGAVFVASESAYVQTKLAKWLASELSEELGARVDIRKVNIDLFNRVGIRGLLVYDQQGDTLLYAGRFRAFVRSINRKSNVYRFGQVGLDSAYFNLQRLDAAGNTNLSFLTDYLRSDEGDAEPSPHPFVLTASEVLIQNSRFVFDDPSDTARVEGINFNGLGVSGLRGVFRDMYVDGDSLFADIGNFHFDEKSGFGLDSLAGLASITSQKISVDSLSLLTERSHLGGRLTMKHGNWSNYAHFVDSVIWGADFNSSTLNLLDLGYFVPRLYGVNLPVQLDGKVHGVIADLKGRQLRLETVGHTTLVGDIDLTGLPDFEDTFIDWRIKSFTSDYDAIDRISRRLMSENPASQTLPVELKRAGTLGFKGSFTGFPRDFVAYGNLRTAAGNLDLDLNVEQDTLNHRVLYRGGVRAFDFDAGHILGIDSLGTVTANLEMVATSKDKFESATLKGDIEHIRFSGYNYTKLSLDGTIAAKRFSGRLHSRDPNADFDFDGTVDLSRGSPFYDFEALVRNIDLTALSLIDFDREFSFSSRLKLGATGENLKDFVGQLTAHHTFLCYGDSSIYLDDVSLSMSGNALNRRINLDTDVVDATITGTFDIDRLPDAFARLSHDVFPSLPYDRGALGNENFEFNVNYQSPNSIIGFFVPGVQIAANTSAYGDFDAQKGTVNLFLRSDALRYDQMALENITVDMGKQGEVLKGKVFSSRASVGDMTFENPDLDFEAYNGFVEVGLGWLNANGTTNGELNASIDVFSKDKMTLQIQPGTIGLSGVRWTIDSTATIARDSTHYSIENLHLSNGANQTISARGSIGHGSDDSLRVSIRAFRIASIDTMGINMGKHMDGTLNLDGTITQFYDRRIVQVFGSVQDFEVENRLLGDIDLSSKYRAKSEVLTLKAALNKAGVKLLGFDGEYAIGGDQPLNGILTLDNFDLDILNAFEIPQVSDFKGTANGTVKVNGAPNKPLLRGYIDLDNAVFKVDYLNVYFRFSDRLRVENDFFGIDYKPIYDQNGHEGHVVASAFHENFSNWTYDISADVSDFMVMNTTRAMNALYYGQAVATGSLAISGYDKLLEVNIDASTGPGTDIKLPLDEAEEVTMGDFVHFVSKTENQDDHDEVDLKGVKVQLNIDATPDAKVQLIFDEAAGDILQGRGTGRLTLETTPAGDFNMFGRFEVVSGTYNFTLRSLVNKQFDLKPGGVIGWYGDPYGADLNLSAVYKLRTPLYPIMVENRELYRNREPVDVVLKLGGKLFEPSIEFEIDLPQSGATEKSQLASAVSTTNELNQQVFSLLILNRFMSVTAQDREQALVSGARALYSANTSEFVSNQLSSWLSALSNDFDIGVNYRPGDEVSNQEIAVALSTRLFDERLAVSGNFGVTGTTDAQIVQGQSGILGDFLVEYMLTKDGKIRLKVFNETNPYEVFSTSSSMYTQGVGLIYREDFDTLGEFIDKLGELFSKDKARGVEMP